METEEKNKIMPLDEWLYDPALQQHEPDEETKKVLASLRSVGEWKQEMSSIYDEIQNKELKRMFDSSKSNLWLFFTKRDQVWREQTGFVVVERGGIYLRIGHTPYGFDDDWENAVCKLESQGVHATDIFNNKYFLTKGFVETHRSYSENRGVFSTHIVFTPWVFGETYGREKLERLLKENLDPSITFRVL